MTLLYLDGAFVDEKEAKISVLNRGFLFGDGVYATIQVRDGHPLFLSIHLERLKRQAKSFGLIPPQIDERAIFELIEKNGAHKGIWKLKVIVMAGEESPMRLPERAAGHTLFLLHPFTPAPYAPLKIALYPHPVMTTHTSFKSLAHLSRYFVMEYGVKEGCDDAFTTTHEGFLLEAAFGNLFWVEGERLYTPDPALPLHFGVTITQILEMAGEWGWETHLVKKPLQDVPAKAHLFRANTMSQIRPVTQVGTYSYPRDLTLEKTLLEKYEERLLHHTST